MWWKAGRVDFINKIWSGSILESKGMHAMFQEKGKKRHKKGKIFKRLGKNVQKLRIFWKGGGHYMQLSHAINC